MTGNYCQKDDVFIQQNAFLQPEKLETVFFQMNSGFPDRCIATPNVKIEEFCKEKSMQQILVGA